MSRRLVGMCVRNLHDAGKYHQQGAQYRNRHSPRATAAIQSGLQIHFYPDYTPASTRNRLWVLWFGRRKGVESQLQTQKSL